MQTCETPECSPTQSYVYVIDEPLGPRLSSRSAHSGTGFCNTSRLSVTKSVCPTMEPRVRRPSSKLDIQIVRASWGYRDEQDFEGIGGMYPSAAGPPSRRRARRRYAASAAKVIMRRSCSYSVGALLSAPEIRATFGRYSDWNTWPFSPRS